MNKTIIFSIFFLIFLTSFASAVFNFPPNFSFPETNNTNITYIAPTNGLNTTFWDLGNNCLNLTGGDHTGNHCLYNNESTNITIGNGIANIFVYDEETNNLINSTTLTTNVYEGAVNNEYSVTTGTLKLLNYSSLNYSLSLFGGDYDLRTYALDINPFTNVLLNTYLINSSEEVIFTTKDKDTNQIVEDVTVTIIKYTDGNPITVAVLNSDVTGRVIFNYNPNLLYQFVVTKEGYTDKTFELNPIIFTEYTVLIEKSVSLVDSSDFAGITLYHTPRNFKAGFNNFTTIISSPDGELEYYSVSISYPGGTNSTYKINSYGSTEIFNFNITGATFTDRVNINITYKSINSNVAKSFSYSYGIIVNAEGGTFADAKDKTYGMGILERLLVFSIFLIFFGGVAFFYGGSFIGVGMSLIITIFFLSIGFIPFYSVVLTIIGAIMLIVWGGR